MVCVCDLCCAPRVMTLSVVWAAAVGCVDVHGLSFQLKPRWDAWSVLQQKAVRISGFARSLLPLEAMLTSMVLAEGPVDARGTRRQQKLCGSPWSVLPLTLKNKQASFVVVLVSTDSQLRMLREKIKKKAYIALRDHNFGQIPSHWG